MRYLVLQDKPKKGGEKRESKSNQIESNREYNIFEEIAYFLNHFCSTVGFLFFAESNEEWIGNFDKNIVNTICADPSYPLLFHLL
jgi:hypothetical protein